LSSLALIATITALRGVKVRTGKSVESLLMEESCKQKIGRAPFPR